MHVYIGTYIIMNDGSGGGRGGGREGDSITYTSILAIYINTCRYAAERIDQLQSDNCLTSQSRYANWKPVTSEEMEGFFAVIINMGVIQLPEIELYWSKWVGEIPFFGGMFARKRFEQIFWMLHVSRDDPTDPGKCINKVKDVLQPLISNFQRSYQPGRNLAVDETMVGFCGRFGAEQYMPAKPTKYGIKAFTLADSENGYLLGCLVYTGRDTLDSARDVYSTLPQPACIVLHVSEPSSTRGTRSTLTGITPAFLWCKHWLNATQASRATSSHQSCVDSPEHLSNNCFFHCCTLCLLVVDFEFESPCGLGWRYVQFRFG